MPSRRSTGLRTAAPLLTKQRPVELAALAPPDRSPRAAAAARPPPATCPCCRRAGGRSCWLRPPPVSSHADGLELGVRQAGMGDQALRRGARGGELAAGARGRSGSSPASPGRRRATARTCPRGGGCRVDGAAHVMGGARDGDDPRRVGAQQRRHQQRGERPVAEVVDAELHLEAVDRAALGDAHHAGVVDSRSIFSCAARIVCGRLAHRRLRAEVERDELERRVRDAPRGCPRRPRRPSPGCAPPSRRARRRPPAPARSRGPSPPFAPVTTAVRPSWSGMSAAVQLIALPLSD